MTLWAAAACQRRVCMCYLPSVGLASNNREVITETSAQHSTD